jgi:serine/threonine protein kinase
MGPDDHPRVAVKELKQMSLSDEEFAAIARTEVGALEMIRNLKHPHLIKAIAYYKKGNKHCVIFPWAEHGNLRDFWKKSPPKLNRRYLRWVFTQFCGLAEAIERLHHSQEDQATRHGDLKPENILCFKGDHGPNGNQDECTLVIADVGLSKSHDKLTEFRKDATRTNSGTIMYEPPETELQPKQPRSRRYDVWSLGCIYLEFVVWLLYGAKDLDRFRSDLTSSGSNTRFYVIEEDSGTRNKTSRLNSAVEKWVDWIKKDPRCPEKTAIRSLVDLIVTRLLIADVSSPPRLVSNRILALTQEEGTLPSDTVPTFSFRPPTMSGDIETTPSPNVTPRATAEEVRDRMREITANVNDKSLEWMVWDSQQQQGPGQFGNRLGPFDRHIPKHQEV